jgi:hypothetical protein
MKTLEEFDFSPCPKVSPTELRTLADGGYLDRAEPVILIGECGNGEDASGHGPVYRGLPPEAAVSGSRRLPP